MKSMMIMAFIVGMAFNSVFALNGMALLTENGKGFNGGGKLYVRYLSDGSKKDLSSSTSSGASFSPDGKKVSFADIANKQIFTCNIDGTGMSKGLASCGTNLAVTYWLPDGYIYFNAHEKEIFRVKADGSGQKESFFKSGSEIQHFGPSNDAKRFAWTRPSYTVIVRDMEKGTERSTGGQCQGTMSPDGEYFTRNNGGHAQFSVHKFSDMTVWKNFKHPGGKSNLHRWSHFSQDHVLYTKEGGFEGVIHNIQTNETTSAGKGVIWDFYGKEIKDPAVSVSQAHVSTISTNGILIRSTISDGVVKVFMPSSGSAIAELLTMNGSRISSQTLNGQGWFGIPVSTTNSAVLMLRIKSAQGVTVQRIINK